MPDGGFAVDLKVLEAHERELRSLLAQMPDAADAAGSLWNPDVFGVVGMFAAQLLILWTDDAAELVGAAKNAGEEMAARFKDMRDAYAEGDQQAAALFEAILEQLEGPK
jgi:hypothetical protein